MTTQPAQHRPWADSELQRRREAEALTGKLIQGMSDEVAIEFFIRLVSANPYAALEIARTVIADREDR